MRLSCHLASLLSQCLLAWPSGETGHLGSMMAWGSCHSPDRACQPWTSSLHGLTPAGRGRGSLLGILTAQAAGIFPGEGLLHPTCWGSEDLSSCFSQLQCLEGHVAQRPPVTYSTPGPVCCRHPRSLRGNGRAPSKPWIYPAASHKLCFPSFHLSPLQTSETGSAWSDLGTATGTKRKDGSWRAHPQRVQHLSAHSLS